MRALLVAMIVPFSGLLLPDSGLRPVRRWAPTPTVEALKRAAPRFPVSILREGFVAWNLVSSRGGKAGSTDLGLRFRYSEPFGSYALPSIGNLSFGFGMSFAY